jgi:exosortase A-associated hydrolase 2
LSVGGELCARFVAGARGRIFGLLHKPAAASGTAVLIVPPLAEEMNKSRKMLAQVAQGLAARGRAALIVDLFGTGDSEGEFRDAQRSCWKSDLAAGADWSASLGWPVRSMLATRVGCILAGEMARERDLALERTVFWQPTGSASRWLDQFLRLRVAASMVDSASPETVAALRARLRAGEVIEVAGYEITSELAAALDGAQLAPNIGAQLGAVRWMEVVRSADAAVPGASTALIDAARAQGRSVDVETFVGEPFWASTEIVCIPSLVERTVESLGAA